MCCSPGLDRCENRQPFPKGFAPQGGQLPPRLCSEAAGKPGPGVRDAQPVLASHTEGKGYCSRVNKNKMSP